MEAKDPPLLLLSGKESWAWLKRGTCTLHYGRDTGPPIEKGTNYLAVYLLLLLTYLTTLWLKLLAQRP